MSVPPASRKPDRSIDPECIAQTLWPSCEWLSGGALDAQRTICRNAVSRFHMDISLLPWTADIIHECSVGWVITFRTRAPVDANER